ncbi:MAG: IPT/TIG domain-containing protein, partial [Vicinamibacteria bacterium]|nr:IPT/TIG domain-containing protein [Vicinamibacteria bacterium]
PPARMERPDYQTEPPSIGVSRPRPPARRPAPPAQRRPAPPIRRRRSVVSMLRLVVLVGAAAVAIAAAAWFFSRKGAPELSSLTPPKAEPGQTVTINGRGFATTTGDNIVHVGGKSAQVLSASAEQIQCQVPLDSSGALKVTVTVNGRTSGAMDLVIAAVPVITGVDPEVAMTGEEVTITGTNLTGDPTTVLVNEIIADVREKQSTRLRFVVPPMNVTLGDSAIVTVRVGRETSRPMTMIIGRLPLLSGIDPKRGAPGTRVVLQGRGFSAEPKGNVVAFGSQPALVLTSTATSITALAPAPIVTQVQADVPVTVKSQGNVSNPFYFTSLGPSAGVYRPFFFPAPTDQAENDHAFVSTELGPVLLLTGKADAASTPERALLVCQMLNRLVDSEPRQTPLFQAQQGRPPRVVSGAVSLVVTDADVAGYSKRWLSSRSASRPSARAVASYWAALLNDYFALFLQKLRPVEVVQLAPSARALLEIYAEAHRRGGAETGVPTALIRPLPSHLAAGLRDMAFMIPSDGGAAQAGTAVIGLWKGTMQESDRTRPFQVTLSGEGSRLAGSLTIQKGKLALQSPLKNVTFAGGTLQFTVVVGASPLFFRGELRGETIEGSIHEQSASGKTAGRFSLKFIE